MKQYKEYKDSGIAWIGAIPSHWQVKRLGSFFTENTEKNTNLISTDAYKFNYGFLVKKNEDINSQDVIETYKKYTILRKNDIVINGLNLNYDFVSQRVAQSFHIGIITSAYLVLSPREQICSPYYCYLLKAMDTMKLFHGMGSGIRLTLSYKDLKNKPLPLPPKAEQEAIVKYLDKKTEQINQYIRLQEQQIQGLQELKQSIIARTVTRGLDPKAPLRPSGIAWIGAIPSHWQVKRLKKQINFINGYAFDSNLFKIDGDTPVIRIGDIVDGKISYNNTIGVNYNSSLSSFEIKPNDILIAMSGATVGKTGIASFSDRGYINQRVGIIRTQKYRYIYYALNSNKFEQYIQLKSNGAAQPNISSSLIQDYPILLPPVEEQEAIVKYLDEKTEQINLLISKTEASIALMKEFKQSLIADAVTGRINVQPS